MSAQAEHSETVTAFQLFMIAAVIVIGALLGLGIFGLVGLAIWMVAMTFVCLGMLVLLTTN